MLSRPQLEASVALLKGEPEYAQATLIVLPQGLSSKFRCPQMGSPCPQMGSYLEEGGMFAAVLDCEHIPRATPSSSYTGRGTTSTSLSGLHSTSNVDESVKEGTIDR